MREFNKKKNGWIFLLLLLTFGIIITSTNLNLFNINSEETILDKKTDDNGIIFNNQDEIEHRNDIPQTADQTYNNIHIISKNDTLTRKDGLNQTISFYFNDTNGNPISDLTNDNITVKDNQTESGNFTLRNGGQGDHNWTLYNVTRAPGYYKLNVSIKGLNSSWVRLELNASYSTNWSIAYIDFSLIGNNTIIKILRADDPGGLIYPRTSDNRYQCFIESNLTFEFILVDKDFNNILILDNKKQASYQVKYKGMEKIGTLQNDLKYDVILKVYKGQISTSILPELGNYEINISIKLQNYEIIPHKFNLTIIEKHEVNITVSCIPIEILAGEILRFSVLAKCIIDSEQFFIEGAFLNISLYVNGELVFGSGDVGTNINGLASFKCTVPVNAINLTLFIEITSGYYYKSDVITYTNVSVITFTKFSLLLLLYIGTAIGIIIFLVNIYRDEIFPKKYKKARILTEIKEIYDNVINLEMILVFHKRTGRCIFFKSFGLDKIVLKQINELSNVISSFGKDLVSQEKINEITHNNKILLLTDGKFIRVALILGNKPSIALYSHLEVFLEIFEKNYDKDLLNWRYQLNLFKNTEQILDEILNTSILLPHKINQEISSLKNLQNKYSKKILEIAKELERDNVKKFFFIATLIEEATSKNRNDIVELFMNIKDRKFFYIETLIEEAINKIGKNIVDIFIGIKELKEKKYFTPIKIYTLNGRSISQQERSLINQKVSELTHFTSEERKKIMNDLMQKNLMEREVYITCLLKQHEIISPPIKSKVEDIKID